QWAVGAAGNARVSRVTHVSSRDSWYSSTRSPLRPSRYPRHGGTAMPKKMISGNSSRTPPEPGTHAEIEDWIRRTMPDLNPIVTWLDTTITKAIPDVRHALKWKKAYYGSEKLGWVIEPVPYDVS